MTLSARSFLIAAVAIGAAAPSMASAKDHHDRSHDGIYAVSVTTKHGSCHENFHGKVSIAGGRVSSPSHTGLKISGEVSRYGAVRLTLKHLWHAATATGKLAKGSGTGTWHSPSMSCTGSWRALRKA